MGGSKPYYRLFTSDFNGLANYLPRYLCPGWLFTSNFKDLSNYLAL